MSAATNAEQSFEPGPIDMALVLQLTIDGAAHARGLTKKEASILNLLMDGLCDKEIADLVGVTTKTMKHHCASIYRKFKAHTRAEVVAKVIGRRP